MKLLDLLPAFKRYALIERGITARTTKEIISTVTLLINKGKVSTLAKAETSIIREFLYEQKQNRLWSNRTFRNKRQYLKSFFDFCIRRGYLRKNPMEAIEKPKIAKALPRCLSKAQVEKLLLVSDTYEWNSRIAEKRNRAIIRTFLFTGIRLSELLHLKTQEVNFEEREIFIKEGKGRKDRIVPIHAELYPYLKSYHSLKKTPTEYFFPSLRSDKPLTEKNLYAVIKKLKKACGFYFSPHMLRHTMGKMAIEANLNPFILKVIMGHADIARTQIYVSVSSRSIKENFLGLMLV